MFPWPALLAVAVLSAIEPSRAPELAAITPHDRPTYTLDGQLAFPANYHEWIFLGAGLDMSYNKNAASNPTHSMFNTVYANPSAYAAFKRTGHWPEGTELVLENRGVMSDASINTRGKTMSPELMGLEVHVLDSARTASAHNQSGWTFYSFDSPTGAKPIPTTADCYSCHQQHGAVDTTFVQFYPTLLDIARARGSLEPQYLHAESLKPAPAKVDQQQ